MAARLSRPPLLTPRNVAVDPAGYLYISEFEGHRVRRVAPDGKISDRRRNRGRRLSRRRRSRGHRSIGLSRRASPSTAPGALLVADSHNHRIRRVVPGGPISTALGGTPATLS